MRKILNFKVSANKNIGGKRVIERYEKGILTKIVAGKGERDKRVQLLQNPSGSFVRLINDKPQNKVFEVLETFSDISWVDATPKDRKRQQHIKGEPVSVVNIRFPNNKIIERGESVTISAACSPSAATIKKAFREQLDKDIKGNPSTDFFTITKI
jgi:hypothetical protein